MFLEHLVVMGKRNCVQVMHTSIMLSMSFASTLREAKHLRLEGVAL